MKSIAPKSACWFCVGALFGSISVYGDMHPNAIFYEDFEEATLGGTYTPPAGNTTGILPSLGTRNVFINDTGEVVAGLDGSAKALAGTDTVTGQSLRHVFFNSTSPTGGQVEWFVDFRVSGAITTGAYPLSLLLRTPSQNLLLVLLRNGNQIYATDSTNSGNTVQAFSDTFAADTEYRLRLDLNLDAYSYDLTVTRLSDEVMVASLTGLDFNHASTLHSSGINRTEITLGQPDFGSGTIVVDNLQVVASVPEPSVAWILGLGCWALGRNILVANRRASARRC